MKRKKETALTGEKLKEYLQRYLDEYYKYGNLQFAIYNYELFENSREMGSPLPEYTRIYKEIVKEYFKGEALEEVKRKYLLMREGIIGKMETVTAYTDAFTVDEYLLNRAELRFAKDPGADVVDEDAAQRIVSRIFCESDNNTINLKLQTMLEQLPVRVTTDRFFDILKNSLELYINGQKSSAEKLRYMIRSAAGLYKPEGMEYFEDLASARTALAEVNFKEIDEDTFAESSELLQDVTNEITELSDYIGLLENAVNQLGIMIFTAPFVSAEAKQAADITRGLTEWIIENSESKEAVPAELVDLFKLGEGKLEEMSENIRGFEGGFEDIMNNSSDNVEGLGMSEAAEAVEACQTLGSDSIYAALDEEETADVADEAFIGELFEKLKEELKDLFKDKEQKRKRAIMAAVLGELPVFFSSKRAVLDYVTNSLRNCSDHAEKRMSIDLLMGAFDEYDGL